MPYRGLRGIELHLSNRHLGVCKPPPVAALRCPRARTPTRVGFWVAYLGAWLWTPPIKPPSRGMQASSSRCAPMSSARTPTRAGFYGLLGSRLLVCKSICHSPPRRHAHSRVNICCSQHRWWVRRPTTSEHSETGGGRRTRQRGGSSQSVARNTISDHNHANKLESDPHSFPGQAKSARPNSGSTRVVCSHPLEKPP